MSDLNSKAEARSLGFMILSSLVHIGLAAAVITMNLDSKKTETTEVEFISPAGEQTEEIQAQAPVVEEEVLPAQAPIQAAEEVVVPAAKPVAPAMAKSLPAAAKAPVVAAAPSAPAKVISEEVAPVAALAPLETEELAAPENIAVEEPVLKDEMIAEDLAQVDQEHQESMQKVQQDLEKQTQQALEEQNQKLLAAQQQAEAEAARQAEEDAQRRAAEAAAAMAAAKQAEQAQAAERAAQAEAEAKAQAEAEARAAQAAKQAEEARAAQARAAGDSNASQMAQAYGIDSEVRSLSELKQKPGNTRPQYSTEDRLKGRAGDVAFLAYISKEGHPVQFKMLQSSGHRELDAKTLKAIKNWKFYPGQEGWVEIPFKWDLKGGPQEMPATLRRANKVSQN